MCCFSGRVRDVSKTRIFARGLANGRQVLVYQMRLDAANPVAMILPLPVPANTREDDVRFIDLQGYPGFFTDLENGFELDVAASATSRAVGGLKVYNVGNYIASFAPTVKDMDRLDAQFRLPADVWKKLPAYADAGFAVFQLKAGRLEVHPMAFDFSRRDPKRTFFPTVHIHDGEVHKTADFDHRLYLQKGPNEPLVLLEKWLESPQTAGKFMKMDKTATVIQPDAHVYRLELRGQLKNDDTWA